MIRRPRRIAAALLALVVALLAAPAVASAQGPPKPSVSADTAIVIDARTGETLYARAPNRRHAIASTTKITTALVARQEAQLSDIFPTSSYRPAPVESQIHLKPGERLTLRDLLRALMLPSANDAAMAIAEGVSGSRSAFVAEMNAKADDLGLRNTNFANPIGLDDPSNYSSARDLALSARALMRDKTMARIVDMPSAKLTTGARPRTVENRNRLIKLYPWVNGVKTGHTSQAGYVLVGSATRGGVRVISVVTGEPSEAARDTDSAALLRYGLGQFRRARVVTAGRHTTTASVKYFDDDKINLVPDKNASLVIRRGEKVKRQVEAPGELEGPIARGERVGTLFVSYRNRVVRRVPLVTAEAVPEASLWHKATGAVGGGAAALALLALVGLGAFALLRVRTTRRRAIQQ